MRASKPKTSTGSHDNEKTKSNKTKKGATKRKEQKEETKRIEKIHTAHRARIAKEITYSCFPNSGKQRVN